MLILWSIFLARPKQWPSKYQMNISHLKDQSESCEMRRWLSQWIIFEATNFEDNYVSLKPDLIRAFDKMAWKFNMHALFHIRLVDSQLRWSWMKQNTSSNCSCTKLRAPRRPLSLILPLRMLALWPRLTFYSFVYWYLMIVSWWLTMILVLFCWAPSWRPL